MTELLDYAAPVLPADSLLDLLDNDWRVNGRCQDMDPTVFFPEKGRPPKSCTEACADCPIRADCLDRALASPWEPYGVWGGMTRAQLLPMWRQLHPVHGENEVLIALGLRK